MFNNPSLLIQPQPPYLRAIVPQPPKLYVQRLVKEFTLLGMTLTSAFEKLRDAGLFVLLVPCPMPNPISLLFRLHEHCLYHQNQGHDPECCTTLHHAIQDLIDVRAVSLFGQSMATNPLPTHLTQTVLSLLGL